MKKVFVLIACLVGAMVVSGCSVKGQIEDIQVDAEKVLQKNSATEFNSGARSRAISSGGYVVTYALGNLGDAVESKTSEQGYQVFSSVQGTVFSEAVEEPAFE